MNDDKNTMPGWINPLLMFSIEDIRFGSAEQSVNPYFLVKDLCQDHSSDFMEGILARYKKISEGDLNIPIVPAEKKILEKLIWPLKAAKQAFILVNYIGCIAICGMVCEMVTIFIFDLAKIVIGSNKIDHKKQEQLFGRKFEELSQKRRIDILSAFGLISDEFYENANKVRKIRNEYLHSLEMDYSNIEQDAEESYINTFKILKSIIDLPIEGGIPKIPGHLIEYLKKTFDKNTPNGA